MTAQETLVQAKAAGLKLWLENRNGEIGINVSDRERIKPFIKSIKANRDAIIEILKRELPSLPERKVPGAIALELTRQWMDIHPTDKLLPLPTRCRWLVGFLPPAKQRAFQYNTGGGNDGRLEWKDWDEALSLVEKMFDESVAKAAERNQRKHKKETL
tara:strand:- start:160 stop:633 length:474 start_codon:yes stop_codon:yes gene_type:complete